MTGKFRLAKRLEAYGRLQQQLVPLFTQKDYEKASEICRKQMQLVPESAEPHYNLACAMSRLGKKDEALLELGQAVELGFNDLAHMPARTKTWSRCTRSRNSRICCKAARDKELNAAS